MEQALEIVARTTTMVLLTVLPAIWLWTIVRERIVRNVRASGVPKTWGDPLLRRVGHRVRKLRDEKGVSQEALADTIGVDRNYLSGIERGVRNLSLLMLRDVAKALNVPIRSLLADD